MRNILFVSLSILFMSCCISPSYASPDKPDMGYDSDIGIPAYHQLTIVIMVDLCEPVFVYDLNAIMPDILVIDDAPNLYGETRIADYVNYRKLQEYERSFYNKKC